MAKQNATILSLFFILLFALIAVYANHFHNGFHFDDAHTIVDNVHIRTIKNIPAFFSDPKLFSSDPDHWGLRPLVTTTLAIDYWLGQSLDPFYFHLDTFIWFIGLAVMLFFMYKNLLKRAFSHQWIPYIALFAAALFTFHKANAETINYVISRSDVLSTFFIVASFLTYIAFPDKRRTYLYIIPALAGVFAKETVLVLVIILFFYILLFEKELSLFDVFRIKNSKTILGIVGSVLPLFILVALVQAYTLSKVSSIPGITNPLLDYLLTQSFVWLRYFIAFFLPMNLSADSDWTVIKNLYDERIIIGLIFVTLLVVAIFKTSVKKETRPIAFGLIWFASSLLPTSVAPFAEVTNDHRMFFPFVGLSLSVVYAIALWLLKYGQKIRTSKVFQPALLTSMLLVLCLHSYGVYQRNKIWKDEESLWLDVTIKSPGNGRGLMNYGLTQMSKGNYAVADSYFQKALVYLPYYSTLYINLGILNGATGKALEAEQHFKKAIELAPRTWDSYGFYARFLMENNRMDDARQMAEKALGLNPYSVMTLNILMSVYNELQLWDKLAETAQKTLELLPEDRLARIYLDAARKREPLIVSAPQEPVAEPKTAADYLNLSLEHYNRQNYQKCIEACYGALKLKPDYADAYSNIGAAYNQMQQWQKGIEACEKALKIDPNHKLAAGNLSWAKTELEKKN